MKKKKKEKEEGKEEKRGKYTMRLNKALNSLSPSFGTRGGGGGGGGGGGQVKSPFVKSVNKHTRTSFSVELIQALRAPTIECYSQDSTWMLLRHQRMQLAEWWRRRLCVTPH